MSGAVDGAMVGVVVAASVGYALYSLGPRTLRPRLRAVIAAALLRLPAATGLHPLARRLKHTAAAATGACGGCDNCGAAPAKPAAGTPAAGTPAAEVRVPLSAIGKRR
jgi:hypothetical protein